MEYSILRGDTIRTLPVALAEYIKKADTLRLRGIAVRVYYTMTSQQRQETINLLGNDTL